MDQKSVGWENGRTDPWKSTLEPGVSVSMVEKSAPSLTVAAVVGVTLIVIIAIIIIFVLGIFIDCRHQRIVEQQMSQAKRSKPMRKASPHPDADDVNIVSNMEQPDLSPAPAESFRNIP